MSVSSIQTHVMSWLRTEFGEDLVDEAVDDLEEQDCRELLGDHSRKPVRDEGFRLWVHCARLWRKRGNRATMLPESMVWRFWT